jgi:preprotein translocase YajC subunit
MDSLWVIALAYPAIIALLFYFAFLRPVQQEQKKQKEQLQSLRVGDEVLTQSGFIAVIKDVRIPEEADKPTEVILDLGGIEVRALASAIAQRLRPADEATETTEEGKTSEESVTLEARG